MRIGLYFGSFNPIHVGHLIIASHVLNTTELDRVWFVVSPHNPLKEQSSLLNEHHRLRLVQLAIEHEPRFRASSVEFALPKPSYTIDTLTYLREKYSQHTFSVVLGSDSLQNIHKWKNYETLLASYALIVYQRPNTQVSDDLLKRVTVLQAPLLDISSTHIRTLIKEKKSIRYLVHDDVLEEIEKSGYYK